MNLPTLADVQDMRGSFELTCGHVVTLTGAALVAFTDESHGMPDRTLYCEACDDFPRVEAALGDVEPVEGAEA